MYLPRLKATFVFKYLLGICTLLLSNYKTVAQSFSAKSLDTIVYRFNNSQKYDSSRLAINLFLQQKKTTTEDRFFAYLYLSYTYKRLQDYAQVHKNLDIALRYGLQTTKPAYYRTYYNCQKSFAFFDERFLKQADSLMQPIINNNYRYLEEDDKGKIMLQKAYYLLINKQYKAAAKMYKAAEIQMQKYNPCELSLVYFNEIQLFSAAKQFDKMEECWKKGIARADSCGILKYKMMCTQIMYYSYLKNSKYQRALYFEHAWDSLNNLFKTNEHINELTDLEDNLKLKEKEDIINRQQRNILKDKLFTNRLLIVMLTAISGMLVLFFIKERVNNRKIKIEKQIFNRQLFEKIEEERKRIATDIHDGISHELILLKTNEQKKEYRDDRVDIILENLREISRNLHPVMFERIGLKIAVEQMVFRIQENNDFMISTELNYSECLPKNTELQLYRIIQECINNIIKHANAFAGLIKIEENKNKLIVTIKDNGKGFNVDQKLRDINSFGLHNIKERAKSIGGKTFITSTKEGTTIQISLPINSL